MPYYPTLAEDIARAKKILAKGKAEGSGFVVIDKTLAGPHGGTIYGADTYAAYKLLESLVAAVEAVGIDVCATAMRVAPTGDRHE